MECLGSCWSWGCLWDVGSFVWCCCALTAELLEVLRTSVGPPSACSVGWADAAGFPRQPEMDQFGEELPWPHSEPFSGLCVRCCCHLLALLPAFSLGWESL